MKRLLVMCLALLMMGSTLVSAAPPTIEAELSIITPVAAFVSTAALDAFRDWAKAKYGVDVKTNYMSKGTQVAAGMVREWGANPQADIIWGGETVLYDELAADGFLIKHEVPQELMDKVPDTMGAPRPMPLKDPKGFWTGTALEPYGLVYNHGLLVRRLRATPPTTWEDLLSDPKFKGQVAQCAPDNSSSNHATYEVILQKMGWEQGWEWIGKLAAYTGQFVARSVDVPAVVANGEYALGFAVPSYMAFENYLNGADIRFIAPPGAYVTPEPIAIIKNCKNPNAAKAFIEFLLTEEGQKLFIERGLFPIRPDMRMEGPPGSTAELAVEFYGGRRSYFEGTVENTYDNALAASRNSEVNEYFRTNIFAKLDELKAKY
ncbi:MAG: extracellular solute-binding protein [Firmicutes bacterium]|jgi:ABC-type Fe3+ transport system substrate-binding protein|nr:extracellular solute-binding protein [Bacillota bacterium]